MVFSSSIFLYYFLTAFLALYWLSPKAFKSFVIAIASYVFYGWWRPDFVLLMLFSTVVDFWCGKAITRAQATDRPARRFVVLSCVVNLGLLGYFKYANFGIDSFNAIMTSFGGEPVQWASVVLPVGISFYTFQTMSYTIDVFRKEAPPVKRFRDFMCYVALFPQLVAGPIVRYKSVAEQLHSRTHTLGKLFQGILFFQTGLIKKVLIADNLNQLVDQAFAAETLGAMGSWLGIVAYAFQIYFDFSGYSDMAIGLGLMIGFQFPINFNQPYRSISITDFWRRWHISLSSWLRDYLYVPLGGNRKGPIRTYINLSLTMLLGGLWHGANWTFIAWGAWQGLWLVLERLSGKKSWYAWAPKPFQIAGTFVIALFGWVLFRATDLTSAVAYAQSMVGLQDGMTLTVSSLQLTALIAGAVVVWAMPTTQRLVYRASPFFSLSIQPLFLLALIHLHYQDHVPFLYYQF